MASDDSDAPEEQQLPAGKPHLVRAKPQRRFRADLRAAKIDKLLAVATTAAKPQPQPQQLQRKSPPPRPFEVVSLDEHAAVIRLGDAPSAAARARVRRLLLSAHEKTLPHRRRLIRR